jgi:NAD(P)H-nitrite reductase large subunit
MLNSKNKKKGAIVACATMMAEKDVKESNVIKVTKSDLKPCGNNEIKLYIARLDYLVDK